LSNKQCNECSEQFVVSEADLQFLAALSPKVGEELLLIPAPDCCPRCRLRRRASFRNDQNYYRNDCSICNKSLISVYSPDKEFPVACEDCFWSDQWDPLASGQEFDFSRSFFEQFVEVKRKTPRLAIFNTQSENSTYTVHSSKNKNCYMASSLVDCEEVHFSDFTFSSKDCLDLFGCHKMELCYECSDSIGCFNSDFVELCNALHDSLLCFDCRNSSHLIGCMGLRNTENQILNQPASKDSCIETAKRLRSDSSFREGFDLEFQKLKHNIPHRGMWTINVENAIGNYLSNSKNLHRCFSVEHVEDGRYCIESRNLENCADTLRISGGEVVYFSSGNVDLRFSIFCNLCYQSNNLIYCDNCQAGSNNSFGCMSLKKGQFCILNRQYTETEYNTLVPKVVAHMKETGEWGDFFPYALSPFGYNETKASEWFPKTEEQATSEGLSWSHYEQPQAAGLDQVLANELPTNISQIDDSILEKAIVCSETGRLFRIVSEELQFYRQKHLPLPTLHPRVRHEARIARRIPYELYERPCDSCSESMYSCYPKEAEQRVFCEPCYLAVTY